LSFTSNYDFQPSSNLTPGVKWLFIINIGLFFVAQIPGVREVISHFAFHADTFLPYQWFTYMFLHFDALHLFFNMLCLFFVGNHIEEALKTREFIAYYLTCGVGAALLGYVVSIFSAIPMVIGASGAIYGLLYALYRINPEAVIYLIVIPIKLKFFLLIMGFFSFAMVLDSSSGTAHFAHLGGLLTGIAWFRYSDSAIFIYRGWRNKQENKEAEVEVNIKQGVDEILEKISREGMGALTKKERQFLNKASNRFKD